MGHNNISETSAELKFFLSPSGFADKTQDRFDKIFINHPAARNYLTFNEYSDLFSVSPNAFAPLLEFAKQHQLDVDSDVLKRELKLNAPEKHIRLNQHSLSFSYLADRNCDKSSDKQLFIIDALGDCELSFNSSPKRLSIENSKLSPSKLVGFTKLFEEKRPRTIELKQFNPQFNRGISLLDFAKLYNFPDGDGAGECIGIIELGGVFDEADLKQYFSALGLPYPQIEVVGLPSKTPENENIEITADIQVVGSLAPKAKLVIYYGTSILDALKNALSDSKNSPSVISISWAGSELSYSYSELNELNMACYEAALRGITVVAASGDSGAFNNMQTPNVNVPANLPFVLGCGGTAIQIQGESLSNNVVWNESNQNTVLATGGGFSQRIASPGFTNYSTINYLNSFPQYRVFNSFNGRPVPDVSANAADSSGYSILYKKQWMKLGGTSLSTPLWAALIARINQALGYRVGYISPFLYRLESSNAFFPSVYGNNGLYVGAYGWNPCTGLGSPNGIELLNAIKKSE